MKNLLHFVLLRHILLQSDDAPFKNVCVTYQRAMHNIFLVDMLHKKVECYDYNLEITSRKKGDHMQDLRMLFKRIRRYQLKMNPLKCDFGVTSRNFLGFIVQYRGIKIDQDKIDFILKMHQPKDIHELRENLHTLEGLSQI